MDLAKTFEELKSELSSLLHDIQAAKSFNVKISQPVAYSIMLQKGILVQSDSGLVINYDYPISILLGSCILSVQTSTFEITNFKQAAELSKQVIREANKLAIVTGTGKFKNYLIRDIIIYSFEREPSILNGIFDLTKNEILLHEVAFGLSYTLPKTALATDDLYKYYKHIFGELHDDGGHQHIYDSLQSIAQQKGKEFLEIVSKDKNTPLGFIAYILIGYAKKDIVHAWDQISALAQNNEYQQEILIALANLPLEQKSDFERVLAFITQLQIDESNKRHLCWIYANLINSNGVEIKIKQKCLASLKELALNSDERTQYSILQVVHRLQIDNDEKIGVILSIDLKNANLHSQLAYTINEFEIDLSFEVFRNVAISSRTHFKTEPFKSLLQTKSRNQPREFTKNLIRLLTDNIGVVRFAASEILQEVNDGDKYVMEFDLLSLSAGIQVRMIDAIVMDFMHPRDVIKYILPFRKSEHQNVLQCLVDCLASIMEDHPSDTINILRASLNPQDQIDKETLDVFENYFTRLSDLITRKNSIEEFNPQKNQARAYNYLARLSKDKMREHVNTAHSQNPLFNFVNKVSLARGKSWKIEQRDTSPSPLSQFSTSIAYPRILLMNPDEYNWDFIVKINTNYKEQND